jgi:hypothetical protein
VTARPRNSRWSREPKRDAQGEPALARIGDGDIEIFRILARYRYLPCDYVAALTGRSLPAMQARLELLCRKPNSFIDRPPQQRANAAANSRRMVYALDEKGAAELRARGAPAPPSKFRRHFAHELHACLIAASFEIATRFDPRIRIISWRELIYSSQMPEATKRLESPQAIPFARAGRAETVVSDWPPFVIERNLASRSFVFVGGIEADCGTEPLESADADRAAIRNKFAAYLACLEQDVPRCHFGATTFVIPFVTTSEARMRSMIDLLDRLRPGTFARRFLFKHVPSFTSAESPKPATGHMLIEPWARAGYEPFSFVE